jgi:hypothetical protein
MHYEFENLIARYGEVVAQAILENLERFEGVRNDVVMPLADRWHNLAGTEQRYAA